MHNWANKISQHSEPLWRHICLITPTVMYMPMFKSTTTVLKWWRHNNEISEIMGLSGYSERTMSKRSTYQKWAFPGKLSLRCYPVILRKLHSNPSNFFFFGGGGSSQKKLEGFLWSFLSITGLRSQRQFARKCSFLASRPLGHCSFRMSWQIP